MKNFIDKTSSIRGTKINRQNLMAVQGFMGNSTVFGTNSITETNSDGEVLTTTFNNDGTITEIFVADGLTISKKTTFNSDGSITEVLV